MKLMKLPKIQSRSKKSVLRPAMLDEYTTADLREIHTVVIFLKSVVDWTGYCKMTFTQSYDLCVAAGPALILAIYEARDMEPMDEKYLMWDSWADIPLFAGFFSRPLEKNWAAREVSAPPEGLAHLNYILETVPEDLDAYTQVGSATYPQQGSRLWTSATWEHLYLDPPDFLRGRLSFNRLETDTLNTFLGPHAWPTSIADLIASIYDDIELQPEFSDSKMEDALCGDCLGKLIREHLHLWLLRRKVDDGWVPPEDCWYGYDCNTQHATSKNHLCAPTK
ncbi:hypothetical protein DFH07DRAFT_981703 [Mycena maculata]|uniref:Uncharacterized protein n=1 Tax=Mycena maculata TaxID=230809 RepID=A0AAD7IEA4_9AGAR|nr:hypothetical protein DFH07DRAFT_981703 [Mycena maculata]